MFNADTSLILYYYQGPRIQQKQSVLMADSRIRPQPRNKIWCELMTGWREPPSRVRYILGRTGYLILLSWSEKKKEKYDCNAKDINNLKIYFTLKTKVMNFTHKFQSLLPNSRDVYKFPHKNAILSGRGEKRRIQSSHKNGKNSPQRLIGDVAQVIIMLKMLMKIFF